jgi:hypothetical protein
LVGIVVLGKIKPAQLSVDMKPDFGFPAQDAADRIAPVDAVPQIDDVLRIPNEQALKRRDQKLTGRKLAYKGTEVLISGADFSIAVIQNLLLPQPYF